jgi:hypothetical protein
MLCTFTTEDGTLVIRSDDIRVIENAGPERARLIFMDGDDRLMRIISGTAAENRDRIQQEELDLIGRVESHRYEMQKQLQAGYPVPPVVRGKR